MKKLFLTVFIFCNLLAFGQIQDAWIYFNDKPMSQYYLDNPLQMLSQKALDRRISQNIALDFTDVPIHEPYISDISDFVEVMAKSKWMNAVHVRGTFDDIIELYDFTFVGDIEFANKLLNLQPKLSQNSIPFIHQKILSEDEEALPYGDSDNQIQMHNGHLLHQEGYTGEGKIIAVLDSGFVGVNTAQAFQKLHIENLILGGYDFVNRDDYFYSGGNHGTRVLSIIGAYQENELVGSAPDAQFYLFITEDIASETPLEESLWVEAAEMADSLGVDIINTSLGYNTFDNPNYDYVYDDMNGTTAFISRGLNYAYSKGILCVTSAGNEGSGSWQYITAPADAQGSLTVGAVNNVGDYASFSSIGPTSDNRIKPDVTGQGVSTVNANQFGTIITGNGTSFSAPVITGLAACLWQAFPDLTNEELMQYIRESADLYDNPTAQKGYGIPNFYQAYQSLKIEEIYKNEFLVFPNPTSDFLYFYTDDTLNGTFKLFDISGKNILENPINHNTQIDVQHLQNGMYFYRILINGQIKTGKIVKK
ncbi:MAG: S8 family serine peptidase [Flavobacteriaceae bacterium]